MVMASNLLLTVIFVTVFPTVYGCGQIPAGQEKTVDFTLSDFKLPAEMAYSEDSAVRMKATALSASKNEAETFVQRIIMQSIKDVLYQQGRSAFLSDYVITLILQQLDVQITYEPLKCEDVINDPTMPNNGAMANKLNCIIVERTVTRTCQSAMPDNCSMAANLPANSKPVEQKHLSISGSLKTSNVIMANWSNQMWQSVLNRVLRRITSGPNGSHFFGASVNLR